MNTKTYEKLKQLEKEIHNVAQYLDDVSSDNLRVGRWSDHTLSTLGWDVPEELADEIIKASEVWLDKARKEFNDLINADLPVHECAQEQVEVQKVVIPWYKKIFFKIW